MTHWYILDPNNNYRFSKELAEKSYLLFLPVGLKTYYVRKNILFFVIIMYCKYNTIIIMENKTVTLHGVLLMHVIIKSNYLLHKATNLRIVNFILNDVWFDLHHNSQCIGCPQRRVFLSQASRFFNLFTK